MGYDYLGLSFQEKKAQQGYPNVVFGMSLIFVFLILADFMRAGRCFSVLLGNRGSVRRVATLWLRGIQNNIFAQIGLIMLIGLAAKNAILMSNLPRTIRKRQAVIDATLEGARLRLRPI